MKQDTDNFVSALIKITHTHTHTRTHARTHARTHTHTHTQTHGLKIFYLFTFLKLWGGGGAGGGNTTVHKSVQISEQLPPARKRTNS